MLLSGARALSLSLLLATLPWSAMAEQEGGCRTGERDSDEKKAAVGCVADDVDQSDPGSSVEALALQQQIDRKAKNDELISNILKKTNETQDSIVGNLR